METNDEVARLVAEAAPDRMSALEPSVDQDVATVATSSGEASAPLDASQPVELVSQDEQPLSVQLPAELNLAEGHVTTDGTIVYEGDGGTAAAVQVLEDDTVRMQTIIPSAEAPMTFTYELGDDVDPILNEDGSVELVVEQAPGVSISVGQVAAPWAVDANGADVPTEYVVEGDALVTEYVVEGDALVQMVHPSSDTAYPVVADPTFGHTYGVPTMYLNWSETQGARDAGYAGWLCGIAPIPMNLICAGNIANITSAAYRAVDADQCVKYLIGPLVVAGLHYSCNN